MTVRLVASNFFEQGLKNIIFAMLSPFKHLTNHVNH